MVEPVRWIFVGVVAVIAGISDVRTRRISNELTFGAAAAGLVFSLFQSHLAGLGMSLSGGLVGLALFLPLFALGGMGAGDVKLLAAFGTWLGPTGTFWAAIWASIVGGVMALVVLTLRGHFSETVRTLMAMAGHWRAVGPSQVPGVTLTDSRGPRLAYAVPIGIGAVLTLLLGLA